jgi:hypothetical protein
MRLIAVLLILFASNIHSLYLNHNIPTQINTNEPIVLTIRTPQEGNFIIKCFFKYNNNQEYESIDLDKLASTLYQVSITPEKNTRSISYYFWVYKDNQFLNTFPENNPISNPFIVINNSVDFEYFTVLSPKIEFPIEYKKELLILVRNNFPKNVTLEKAYFNDDEPLTIINKNKILISLRNTFALRAGKNRLTIVAKRDDGAQIKQLYTLRQKREKRKKSFKKFGDVKLVNQFYSTEKTTKPYKDVQLSYITNYKLRNNYSSIHAYGLYDNRESSQYQPYSRFFLKANDSKSRISIQLGDVQQSYSALTVSGRRVRGISTELDLLKMFNKKSNLKLSFISGRSNNAIKISSENNSAIYEQNVLGSQLLFSTMKYKTTFQYFHIKDASSSLSDSESGSTKPVENHLTSLFMSYRPTPLSLIQNELAAGAYYADSTAPTVNIDDVNIPDELKAFIEENLPIKSSLTAGYSNKFLTQFPVYSRNHIVKFGSNWVHPSYINALNSTIETDKDEKYLALSQKFLNRKLIVNSLIKSKKNNVVDSQINTTSTNTLKLSSVYKTNNFGSFNMSILNTGRNKDSPTLNMKIDNMLNYLSLGFNSIPIDISKKRFYLNVMYSYSDYKDQVSNQNNSSTNAFSTTISSNLDKYDVALGINQSVSDSQSTGETNYLTVFNNLRRKFYDEKMNAYSRTKLLFTNNNSDANKLNSTKLIQTLGFSYRRTNTQMFKSSTISFNLDLTLMEDSQNKDDKNLNYMESLMKVVMFNSF